MDYGRIMPVYHLTVHAFGSWTENHPRGYVQRSEGLKPPNERLHRARRALQKQPAVRFDATQQALIHEAALATMKRRDIRLHAAAVTATHAHLILSYHHPLCTCRSPASACGAPPDYCQRGCPARTSAEKAAGRFKKNAGMALSSSAPAVGRRWFSRGWDLTPVRTPQHLSHLMTDYLPAHTAEGGLVRIDDTRYIG